jgi:hypothetical protein
LARWSRAIYWLAVAEVVAVGEGAAAAADLVVEEHAVVRVLAAEVAALALAAALRRCRDHPSADLRGAESLEVVVDQPAVLRWAACRLRALGQAAVLLRVQPRIIALATTAILPVDRTSVARARGLAPVAAEPDDLRQAIFSTSWMSRAAVPDQATCRQPAPVAAHSRAAL